MSTSEVKRREFGRKLIRTCTYGFNGGPITPVTYDEYLGFEEVRNHPHPWPPTSVNPKRRVSRLVRGRYDFGGGYTLLRKKIDITPTRPLTSESGFYRTKDYIGICNSPDTGGTPSAISPLIMNAIGTKGWNQYKPTARQAGLDQFIGELRELPRAFSIYAYKNALKEIARGKFGNVSGKGISKAVAGDYLNFQFGWLPFYNEIKDLLANYLKEEELIQQLARDNGRPVRRSGPVDIVKSTSTSVSKSATQSSYIKPALPSALYDGPATRWVTTTVSERYWFSGRFRYWLPALSNSPGSEKAKEQARRIIYGAEVTPNTLYQLMPWSWLIDWFSPVGSVISNMNDRADNLTADYAYAMGHKTETIRTVCQGKLKNSSDHYTMYEVTIESQNRSRASPYGFGVLPSSFSTRQIAILASLGVTKFW